MLQTFRKHLKDVRPDEIDSYIDKAFGLIRDDYEVISATNLFNRFALNLERIWKMLGMIFLLN